jgi:bifunctional DNA-binding transcriptional regulator/antitoxin component of YhaV-PrlF toxin-antitoxin module
MQIKVVKMGVDSFYMLIPKSLKEYFDINEGDLYEIKITKNTITYNLIEKQSKLSDFNKMKGGNKKDGE